MNGVGSGRAGGTGKRKGLDASVYEYDDGKEGIQNSERQPCQTVECVYPDFNSEKTKSFTDYGTRSVK